jgi:hypothetical protein
MLSSEGGAGGGSVCDDGEDGSGLDMSRLPEPTIAIGTPQRPNFEVVEVAQPIQLCLWRFRSDAPVQVTVSYPDGRVAVSSGTAYVNWAAVPGDPLGDYQVTAVQGQLRALGTVRVVDATERRLLVVGNGVDEQAYQRFERGQTIQVAIGGYRPWSGVQLLVYHTPEGRLQRGGPPLLEFRTWVQLRTDGQGGSTYSLRTAAGDPSGCYGLDTLPEPQTTLRGEESHLYVNTKATEPLFCLT